MSFAAQVVVGSFGDFDRQPLDPESAFHRARPDITVLLPDCHDLLAPIFEAPLSNAGQRESLLDHAVGRVATVIAALDSSRVLLANGSYPPRNALGLQEAGATSIGALVARYNQRLVELVVRHPHVELFDYAGLVLEEGYREFHDPRMWAHARMRVSGLGVRALAHSLSHAIVAGARPPKRCLVLDLDGTLWGGTLGEDGIGGVAVGGEGVGVAFAAFQRELLELRARGVLLAVASKNDAAEALEAIERHPGMLIRRSDLAAVRIGWGSKADSLREIAEELGFGLDAVAFVDDSPHERELVRSILPEVVVIDLPADPAGYVDALRRCGLFDTPRLTQEDLQRQRLVTDEQARQELRGTAGSVEAYLASLEVEAEIALLDEATLPRAAQLCAKTNQFNLALQRFDLAALRQLAAEGAIGLTLRARDRLGDAGLVAFALAWPQGDTAEWHVLELVMSCRVIGRGLESALLAELAAKVRALGAQTLVGLFREGPRNGVCADFYARHGFVLRSQEQGTAWWQRSIDEDDLPIAPSYIRIVRS